jgi:hypothetical protein
MIAAAPAVGGFTWTALEAERAQAAVQAATQATAQSGPYQPKFFTQHEWETVRVLVDLIIPKDERSGSATDAGVPEFMDFMMTDVPARQTPMRGGLAWLDHECEARYDKTFVACTPAERTAVLDRIAWPQKADESVSQGVAFFNSFRDLTASGFWTSRMGIKDLQYMGNVYVPEWTGCPPEVLQKLGLDA